MHLRALRLTAAVAATGALAFAGVASADTPTDKPAPTAAAPSALPGKAPRGYAVVTTPFAVAPTGAQSTAHVECPLGTVPLGGGVFVQSNSTAANINSSAPTPTGWTGWVNNTSGFTTFFQVQAICARKPDLYTVVTSAENVPGQSHLEVFAQCPKGTKPLGGGGYTTSLSLSVNLSGSYASGQGWRSTLHNQGVTTTLLQTYAVCGRVKGYTVAVGPEQGTPGASQTRLFVACPAPTVPTGGGVLTLTSNLSVNLNSTIAFEGGWETFVNSATTLFETAIPVVVCAGV
jgi:hypothetical protein